VGTSGGIENWLYGVAVAYTSAPCTGPPQVEVTWKRTTSVVTPLETTCGSLARESTSSRAGDVMFATWSGFPPDGQPAPREGVTAVTTAVAPEVAKLLPAEFVALTLKR